MFLFCAVMYPDYLARTMVKHENWFRENWCCSHVLWFSNSCCDSYFFSCAMYTVLKFSHQWRIQSDAACCSPSKWLYLHILEVTHKNSLVAKRLE